MIGVDELLALILAEIGPLPPVRRFLLDCVYRVLAEDLVAVDPLPPFANAAMDGFAVRRADLDTVSQFRLVDDLPAGRKAERSISTGEAASIATGAMLPAGADTVVPLEQASLEGDHVSFKGVIPSHGHIRLTGEDVAASQVIARAGRSVTSRLVTVAAATGIHEAAVVPAPRLGILSTGDELVSLYARCSTTADDSVPGYAPLKTGTIRDTNDELLSTAALDRGVPVGDLGRCRDDATEIADRLWATQDVDAILVTGGLGKGRRDVVVEAIGRIGTIRAFEVAMRPGKLFAFGVVNNRPVFAVPGNPVAALAAFYTLVEPPLRRMAGLTPQRSSGLARLEADIENPGGRRHLIRVRLDWAGSTLIATPIERHGSGNILSLADADGFVVIPETVETARAGESYRAIPFEAKELW